MVDIDCKHKNWGFGDNEEDSLLSRVLWFADYLTTTVCTIFSGMVKHKLKYLGRKSSGCIRSKICSWSNISKKKL